MPSFLLALASQAVIGALMVVAGCAKAATPASCEDALGVYRTVSLTADSPPLLQLLGENEVVLTFDDGPHASRTAQVLDLLDGECTQATFFLIGTEAAQYPDLVKDILARGHTIGNHSWSHPYLSQMPIEAALADILKGSEAISAAAGQPVTLFRFPFIATTPELHDAIRQEGLIDVTVTVDGADWTRQSPEQSVAMIMAKLEASQRRGIVLLHDPYTRSDARTRILLQSLKTEGYRVVGISAEGG